MCVNEDIYVYQHAYVDVSRLKCMFIDKQYVGIHWCVYRSTDCMYDDQTTVCQSAAVPN